MEKKRLFWANECFRGVLIILAFVLAGNFINIFLTNPDPLITRSGLGVWKETILGNYNGTEVNDGAVSQALGVASVNQILSGKLPLWNHHEGVGAPLAGGMQPASLFLPFNLLLALPNGFLIFRIVLEFVAGVGMFLFLRKLKIRNNLAIFGGILFALNGTFAILGNAIFNPIAFFPWILFGLEKIKEDVSNRRKSGYAIFAISLAFSINAGFPETAYLNGLLVFAWFVFSAFEMKNDRKKIKKYIIHVLVAGILGIILSLPAIYLFLHYLQSGAHIGGHDGSFLHKGAKSETLPMLIFPYIYGLIFQNPEITSRVWGQLGGFIGLTAMILAGFGAFNSQIKLKIRLFFSLAALLAAARIAAVPVITHIVDILPLMSSAAAFRYLPPVLILSVIVLACFGLEYCLQKNQLAKKSKTAFLPVIISLIFIAGGLVIARLFIEENFTDKSGVNKYYLFYVILSLILLALASWLAFSKRVRKRFALIFAVIAIFETLGSFWLPQLAAPIRSKAKVDTSAVEFLQENIGNQRFYYIGGKYGLKTNYASYFGISSINNENLPTPLAWDDFVKENLDNNTDTISFSGAHREDWLRDPAETEFYKNIEKFKSVGVKYLVSEIKGEFAVSREQMTKRGAKIVYSSEKNNTIIYQIPDYKNYFTAEGCKIEVVSRDEISADCEKPTTLERLELYFDGWRAEVNGAQTEITQKNDIFQAVNLPAGKSKVKFTFWPKYLTPVMILSITAWLGIIIHQLYANLTFKGKKV
ncbi:MAG: YfhO family protein [bacterium]|nr:YfhO family protein [bacterium]MDO4872057.1 YfhO family protein [bacterium]